MFRTFPVWTLVLLAMAHVSSGTAQGPLSLEARVKIDFSYAGYGGGADLPQVDAVLSVRPSGGDDTALLQAALDAVAMRPLTASGLRGALQLAPGVFHVAGSLDLRASGVVLRGAGNSAGGTTILAEGTGRRTLIEVGNQREPDPGPETRITRTRRQAVESLRLHPRWGFALGTMSLCGDQAPTRGLLPWA